MNIFLINLMPNMIKKWLYYTYLYYTPLKNTEVQTSWLHGCSMVLVTRLDLLQSLTKVLSLVYKLT